MHGGYRIGSGRKTLDDKKSAVTIYLSDYEKNLIENSPLPSSTTFSQKCRELISIGLNHLENNLCLNVLNELIIFFSFLIFSSRLNIASARLSSAEYTLLSIR